MRRNKYEKNRNKNNTKEISNKTLKIELGIIYFFLLTCDFFLTVLTVNLGSKIAWVADKNVSIDESKIRFQTLLQQYNLNGEEPNKSSQFINLTKDLFTNWRNATSFHLTFAIIFIVIAVLLFIWVIRLYFRQSSKNFNQHGHAQFADSKDIENQYPSISLKNQLIDGYGGLPVAFRKARAFSERQYYFDDTTVNNLVIGQTRSGKDQVINLPMILLLSKSTKPVSLIINDPKMETYKNTYKTLRKNNFDVLFLNLEDPNLSMQYNELQEAIDLARLGYIDEVQKSVNALATKMYYDKNAKDKIWQQQSAVLLDSVVFALLAKAEKENNYDKVNLANATQMIIDLGGTEERIPISPKQYITKTRLTIYFEDLKNKNNKTQFENLAVNAFQQSEFATDGTKGSIYLSAVSELSLYQQKGIAKMTSKNTLPLDRISNSKILTIQMEANSNNYRYKTAKLQIYNSKSTIFAKEITSDNNSVFKIPLDIKVPDKFYIKLSFSSTESIDNNSYILWKSRKVYKRHGLRLAEDEFTNEKILNKIDMKEIENTTTEEVTSVDFIYSDKNVAVFLLTPMNDPAYNKIAVSFIQQTINVAINNSANSENKNQNRIHFIFNEFGSLPSIPGLSSYVTQGLGLNILFTFYLQNMEQLRESYTAEQADTIKSNCGNWIYLLSNSKRTNDEIVETIGKRTVEAENTHRTTMKINSSANTSLIGQDLITASDLSMLQNGEDIVIRTATRMDLKGKKIMPYPIFNNEKNALPFVYQNKELKDEFDFDTKSSLIQYMNPIDIEENEYLTDWNKEYEGKVVSDNQDNSRKSSDYLIHNANSDYSVDDLKAVLTKAIEELQKNNKISWDMDIREKVADQVARNFNLLDNINNLNNMFDGIKFGDLLLKTEEIQNINNENPQRQDEQKLNL